MSSEPRIPKVTDATYNRRGFFAHFVTMFQGAFSDNLFQYLIIFSLLGFYAREDVAGTLSFDLLGSTHSLSPGVYVPAFATVVFSIPFVIFPALFGAIADKFSKQRVAVASKTFEIIVMTCGGLALYFNQPHLIWAMLFLMATQSAMFGPAKYGIMPEILPESRLSAGNGIVQMGTIVAIIAGMGLAGPVYQRLGDQVFLAAAGLVLLAMAGLTTAQFITRPPAANPQRRIPRNPLVPWSGMGPYFRAMAADGTLFNVVVGGIYFWFAGALLRNNLLTYASEVLMIEETPTSGLLAAIALGIGIGALSAGLLSRRKIEFGLVPIGIAGMTLFPIMLAIPLSTAPDSALGMIGYGQYGYLAFMAFAMGFSGGVFVVPLAASLQKRAPSNMKGGVIATFNMMTFVGMTLSGFLIAGLGFVTNPNVVFLLAGMGALGIATFLVWRMPFMLVRTALWFLANTLYRVVVAGRDNVPEEGGALFVANHQSLIEALTIQASTDRELIFVLDQADVARPWAKRIAALSQAIVFDPGGSDAAIAEVEQAMRDAIARGRVVCASTQWPRRPDGSALPFQEDFTRVLEGVDAPLTPVRMEPVLGVLYTRDGDRARWRWPKRVPYRIQVLYGAPAAADGGTAGLEASLAAAAGGN